jgi:hypothetical protein
MRIHLVVDSHQILLKRFVYMNFFSLYLKNSIKKSKKKKMIS